MALQNWGTKPYLNTALSATKAAAVTVQCRVFRVHFFNPNTSTAYLQMFDLASGDVTVGATTPTRVFALPAGGGVDADMTDSPMRFATAVTVAATTTSTGNTAPSTAILAYFEYVEF